MRCSLPTAPREGLNTGKWIVDYNKKSGGASPPGELASRNG